MFPLLNPDVKNDPAPRTDVVGVVLNSDGVLLGAIGALRAGLRQLRAGEPPTAWAVVGSSVQSFDAAAMRCAVRTDVPDGASILLS